MNDGSLGRREFQVSRPVMWVSRWFGHASLLGRSTQGVLLGHVPSIDRAFQICEAFPGATRPIADRGNRHEFGRGQPLNRGVSVIRKGETPPVSGVLVS